MIRVEDDSKFQTSRRRPLVGDLAAVALMAATPVDVTRSMRKIAPKPKVDESKKRRRKAEKLARRRNR